MASNVAIASLTQTEIVGGPVMVPVAAGQKLIVIASGCLNNGPGGGGNVTITLNVNGSPVPVESIISLPVNLAGAWAINFEATGLSGLIPVDIFAFTGLGGVVSVRASMTLMVVAA